MAVREQSWLAMILTACLCAGTSTSSNEAKLIGIIVGVVIACALLLLILCSCWVKQRRKTRAAAEDAAAAKGVPGVEGKQDSVYVHGIKVNTTGSFDPAADLAAVDSPEHKEKMKKLAAMNFQKTKSPRGQIGAFRIALRAGRVLRSLMSRHRRVRRLGPH